MNRNALSKHERAPASNAQGYYVRLENGTHWRLMPIPGMSHMLRIHDRLHVDPRTPWRHLRKDGTHVDVHTLPFTPEGLEIVFDITQGLRKAGYKTLLREDELCGFPVYTLLAFPPKRPNRKERGASL